MAVSHGILDQVDDIIGMAKVATATTGADGALIQSNLAKYGCLLLSAAMERALIGGVSGYAGRVGDERIGRFIEETLATGRNPTPEYIKEVIGRLEPSWGNGIWLYMVEDVGLDKVRSVVSNRNRIAHGMSVTVGVKSLMDWAPAIRKLCLEIHRVTGRR